MQSSKHTMVKRDRCTVDLTASPILYRFFHLLTPPSELPTLPTAIQGYLGVHVYTVTQILLTVVIFVVTLTKGAPAFPVIIIALVPARLLLMNKLWSRESLRFVDAWACRDGTPEDDQDRKAATEPGPNVERHTNEAEQRNTQTA